MADELRCIHCGYQQTEHENKHFVEGYAEATEKEIRTHKACIRNGWPCNKFTPDKKEFEEMEKIHEEELNQKHEYMLSCEGRIPLGALPVIITNR